jgi:hypothetical protein
MQLPSSCLPFRRKPRATVDAPPSRRIVYL